MKSIKLLKPEHGSTTEDLHALQWPAKSEADLGSAAPREAAERAPRWDALAVISEDRSIPRAVCFAWEGIEIASARLVYDLLIAADPAFAEPLIFKNIPEPGRGVVNLHMGTRYFWQVRARERDALLAVSPVWSFTTHPAPPRWLHVPGITNVRDMGGWRLSGNRRIRQGLIYRSSEMNGHVAITDEGRRILLDDLKIRTDIDLRGSNEETQPVLDQSAVKWINVPISPYAHIVAAACRQGYRDIFRVFAEPSAYPILFHCWGGCDRGGTVAFLLHALLGLDRDALVRDYELSSLTIWGERSHRSEEFQSLCRALRSFGEREDDIHGQVEGYLLSTGVTAEELASIRARLIERI